MVSRPTRPCLSLLLATLAPALLGAQERGGYPAADHGGNYMHNFYLPPAPSSTPWYPAWHPDGETVTVAMGGSIWSVDPRSGVATQLTSGSSYHSSPAWSPDGRWLVHTADENGHRIGLRVLDAETGEAWRLTDDDHLYLDPVFSPSGDRLAYVSTRPEGYFNVYVRPIENGRWAGPAVAVTRDARYERSRLYFGPWDMHLQPAWTPDGEELLLLSNRGVPLGSGHVWRVPARQDGMDEAVPVLREQTLYRTRPDVSIDGKRFVYASTAGAADQYNNLYVQPTDGGTPYKLTFFDHDAFHPRWSPDGRRIAYIDNREGLPQLALLDTYGGANRIVHVTERRWREPVGTLAVTVRDAASGAPTDARIHLRASDGRFYAPADAYARIGRAGDDAFHTNGRFEVELPPGPVELVAVKGFERWPDSTTAEVEAGGRTEVMLSLEPMVDMAAEGWFSGSTHVHMNYAGNLHNTPRNLLFMSAAEDQDVVNELVANKDNRILDHHYFVPGGGPHPASTPERPLVVGEEYRPPFYGHVFMIGLRDHLISPFVTGYEGTGIESLFPTNTDMLRLAKEQGAFTGYVHPFSGSGDPLERGLGGAKGFLMDVPLAATDALEWSRPNEAGFFPLYAAWNNGFWVVATGGEDSISNLHDTPFVGSHRTYVHTDDGRLTWDRWISALRRGRAFVSNGPLVTLEVDGRGPGETVSLPPGGGEVTLRARVRSIVPLRRMRIVRDGQLLEEIDLTGEGPDVRIERRYPVEESGWLHVRVSGDGEDRGRLDTPWPQAFTNPVRLAVGGEPVRSAESARYGVRWIEELRGQADDWPWWRSEEERAHLHEQLDEARRIWEERAREAGGG